MTKITLHPAQDGGAGALPSELLERIGRGEIDLSTRRFLCGHYSANLTDHLPGDWRTVTFLRDPVRRSSPPRGVRCRSIPRRIHRSASAPGDTRLDPVITCPGTWR